MSHPDHPQLSDGDLKPLQLICEYEYESDHGEVFPLCDYQLGNGRYLHIRSLHGKDQDLKEYPVWYLSTQPRGSWDIDDEPIEDELKVNLYPTSGDALLRRNLDRIPTAGYHARLDESWFSGDHA